MGIVDLHPKHLLRGPRTPPGSVEELPSQRQTGDGRSRVGKSRTLPPVTALRRPCCSAAGLCRLHHPAMAKLLRYLASVPSPNKPQHFRSLLQNLHLRKPGYYIALNQEHSKLSAHLAVSEHTETVTCSPTPRESKPVAKNSQKI